METDRNIEKERQYGDSSGRMWCECILTDSGVSVVQRPLKRPGDVIVEIPEQSRAQVRRFSSVMFRPLLPWL